jgi:hypothetical protein
MTYDVGVRLKDGNVIIIAIVVFVIPKISPYNALEIVVSELKEFYGQSGDFIWILDAACGNIKSLKLLSDNDYSGICSSSLVTHRNTWHTLSYGLKKNTYKFAIGPQENLFMITSNKDFTRNKKQYHRIIRNAYLIVPTTGNLNIEENPIIDQLESFYDVLVGENEVTNKDLLGTETQEVFNSQRFISYLPKVFTTYTEEELLGKRVCELKILLKERGLKMSGKICFGWSNVKVFRGIP